MKPILLILFLIAVSTITHPVYGVNRGNDVSVETFFKHPGQMTVNDFISVDFKNYRTEDGKKLKWTSRLVFTGAQKKLARQVKQHKLDGNISMIEAAKVGGRNIHGLLSVIFAAAGLFIPVLGFGLIVAALVLGIIGIRRDYNPTMAIIGTALSGAFLLLFLILLVVGIGLLLGWG